MFRFLGERLGFAALVLAGIAGIVALVRYSRDDRDVAAAEQAIAERRFADAGEPLERHLQAHPDDKSNRFLAARTARRASRFDEAYRHLRYLEADPGFRDAAKREYQLIGFLQGQLNDADEMDAFCRTHPDDKDSPFVVEALIIGYLNTLAPPFSDHMGVPSEAHFPRLEKCKQLIAMWLEMRPGEADQLAGLLWRARARKLLHDRFGAIEDLKRVLAGRPDELEAAYYYALFISHESPGEARDRLEALEKKHPENPHILFALGSILRTTGSLERAGEVLDRLLALYPSHLNSVYLRGLIALDAQRPGEAEVLLKKVLEQSPKSSEAYAALARCMVQLNRPAEARRYQDRFLELEAAQKLTSP